jgi:chromosome segregation ATPase
VFTIHSLMLVSLGFLFAVLLGFVVAPAYWARAVRLTTERIRRSLPMSEAEMRAERDKLRAEHAVRVYRLEAQTERARLSAARQRVEINRRDGLISTLERQVRELRTNLEASDNARKVLEQTIVDRVPKIEARLTETRKLLSARDKEIGAIKSDASKTFQALDEAMQINAQQRNEIDRLRTALTTRTGREGAAAPRHDTEIALRSEIEELRARTRDQASLISRLQELSRMPDSNATANQPPASNVVPLTKSEEQVADSTAAMDPEAVKVESLGAEIATLKAANRAQAEEIEKLKTSLRAFEQEADPDRQAQQRKPLTSLPLNDSKVALRARVSSAEDELIRQSQTIERLRAELVAANDRIARQATQYREELRHLGSGTVPTSIRSRGTRDTSDRPTAGFTTDEQKRHNPSRRPSLARRIVEEFPETSVSFSDTNSIIEKVPVADGPTDEVPPAVARRHRNSEPVQATEAGQRPDPEKPDDHSAPKKKTGRTGLMERIAGLSKG